MQWLHRKTGWKNSKHKKINLIALQFFSWNRCIDAISRKNWIKNARVNSNSKPTCYKWSSPERCVIWRHHHRNNQYHWLPSNFSVKLLHPSNYTEKLVTRKNWIINARANSNSKLTCCKWSSPERCVIWRHHRNDLYRFLPWYRGPKSDQAVWRSRQS